MEDFARPAGSLDDVAEAGHRAMGTYLAAGESTRSNRTWINLGILAANTFVTTAAGLEAHPDSIFAGSMVGQLLFGLDPIVNAGSTTGWSRAFARTACIVGFVDIANTAEVQSDVAIVRRGGSDESAAAWSAYLGLISFAKSELVSTYADYLAARTPALIEPVQRPASAPPTPTPPPPDPTEAEDELETASKNLSAIVTASRAGITQCRPSAPAE